MWGKGQGLQFYKLACAHFCASARVFRPHFGSVSWNLTSFDQAAAAVGPFVSGFEGGRAVSVAPARRGTQGRAPGNLRPPRRTRRGGVRAPAATAATALQESTAQLGNAEAGWFGPLSLRTCNPDLRRAGSPRLPFPPLLHPRVRPCVSVLLLGLGRACEGLGIGVVHHAAYFNTYFGPLFVLFSSAKRLLPSSKTRVEKGLLLHVTRPTSRPPTAEGGN